MKGVRRRGYYDLERKYCRRTTRKPSFGSEKEAHEHLLSGTEAAVRNRSDGCSIGGQNKKLACSSVMVVMLESISPISYRTSSSSSLARTRVKKIVFVSPRDLCFENNFGTGRGTNW